ncbi:hypothetical protein DENSPDRAFT_328531 [Dentipellis sp. KUC8613]|nr:hypothetical protein DENSPDRAFT_328531 [Dentipellis sp. KUC8613]
MRASFVIICPSNGPFAAKCALTPVSGLEVDGTGSLSRLEDQLVALVAHHSTPSPPQGAAPSVSRSCPRCFSSNLAYVYYVWGAPLLGIRVDHCLQCARRMFCEHFRQHSYQCLRGGHQRGERMQTRSRPLACFSAVIWFQLRRGDICIGPVSAPHETLARRVASPAYLSLAGSCLPHAARSLCRFVLFNQYLSAV